MIRAWADRPCDLAEVLKDCGTWTEPGALYALAALYPAGSRTDPSLPDCGWSDYLVAAGIRERTQGEAP